MVAFLRQYVPGHWLDEIVAEFNARFGLGVSGSQLRCVIHEHGIKSEVKSMRQGEKTYRLTTPEQDELVRRRFHLSGKGSYKEVQAYLQSLGVDMTIAQVKGYLARKRITMQVYGYFKKGCVPANKGKKMPPEVYAKVHPTMFGPGNRPANWKPVGSERVNIYGYVEVKVKEPRTWRVKARVLWEQATGETLTRNDRIIYLDGNKQNLSLDNLAKITGSQLARLNQNHLIYPDAELTKSGVLLAKVLEAKGKAIKQK